MALHDLAVGLPASCAIEVAGNHIEARVEALFVPEAFKSETALVVNHLPENVSGNKFQFLSHFLKFIHN